jgi:hypothetical protein
VSTKFVQIKALGFKLAPLLGAYIQVSDFRAIMALLFFSYFPLLFSAISIHIGFKSVIISAIGFLLPKDLSSLELEMK